MPRKNIKDSFGSLKCKQLFKFTLCRNVGNKDESYGGGEKTYCLLPHLLPCTVHYVHFVKYDDAVSFYDAVSDTIRRRGGNRGIFTEEGVDTVAYFGGNHGSRV